MSGPAFLTETRERFLKAILAQLPIERIRELYLFPPIKQGGVESGVAVVAAWPEGTSAASREATVEPPVADEVPAVPAEAGAMEPDHPAEDDIVPVDEPPTVALDQVTGEVAETNGCPVPVAAGEAVSPHVDAPVAAADGDAPAEAESVDVLDATSEGAGSAAADARRPAPDEKYTVYSARYRHVLKGPDRGKWEANVVAEADAPLISIETVVRGVQRRAGDVEGPDHMTVADLRAALRLPANASAA